MTASGTSTCARKYLGEPTLPAGLPEHRNGCDAQSEVVAESTLAPGMTRERAADFHLT